MGLVVREDQPDGSALISPSSQAISSYIDEQERQAKRMRVRFRMLWPEDEDA